MSESEAIVIDRRDELAVPEPVAVEPLNLFGATDPVAVIEQASRIATALKDVVDAKKLVSDIKGKAYPHVEAWTLLGSMLGVFPVTVWTHELENGWEARVEAVTRAGDIVGAAEAQCTRDESLWKSRDGYALRAMAQTRAVSRALRQPLGFVMVLAGYEATPEAEMPQEAVKPLPTRDDWGNKTIPAGPKPAGGDRTKVSKSQLTKLVLLAKELGWDDTERRTQAGVESFTELSKAKASELIELWSAWREIDEKDRQTLLESPPEDAPASGEVGHSGGDQPNDIQWDRAQIILGTKARILNLAHNRFGTTELIQLTKAQLAELIQTEPPG